MWLEWGQEVQYVGKLDWPQETLTQEEQEQRDIEDQSREMHNIANQIWNGDTISYLEENGSETLITSVHSKETDNAVEFQIINRNEGQEATTVILLSKEWNYQINGVDIPQELVGKILDKLNSEMSEYRAYENKQKEIAKLKDEEKEAADLAKASAEIENLTNMI